MRYQVQLFDFQDYAPPSIFGAIQLVIIFAYQDPLKNNLSNYLF